MTITQGHIHNTTIIQGHFHNTTITQGHIYNATFSQGHSHKTMMSFLGIREFVLPVLLKFHYTIFSFNLWKSIVKSHFPLCVLVPNLTNASQYWFHCPYETIMADSVYQQH